MRPVDSGVTVTPDQLIVIPVAGRQAHRWRDLLGATFRFGRTRVGLSIVVLVVSLAAFGPLVAPHSDTAFVGAPYSSPSQRALLGTDYLGRDLLSRFLAGGRTVLLLAFVATLLGVVSGTILGLIAGFSLRAADEVVMRAMDLILAFPAIVLVLLFVSIIGPALWLLALTVGVSHTPQVARVMRSATVQVAEADFVRYAEALGVSRFRILFSEILPNVVAPLTVEFGLRLTYSIGIIASLDYLGFGLQPPAADWGLMVNENQLGLTVAPLPVLLPVIAIALITVGMNLLTDGFGRAVAGLDRKADGK
jgi:peptide/nickel transport system permease protein